MLKLRNGTRYKVLEQTKKCMLLENVSPTKNKFVVCINYDYYNDYWQSGNYYDNFPDAKKYFNKITK